MFSGVDFNSPPVFDDDYIDVSQQPGDTLDLSTYNVGGPATLWEFDVEFEDFTVPDWLILDPDTGILSVDETALGDDFPYFSGPIRATNDVGSDVIFVTLNGDSIPS